jgi:hypothetical protein
MPQIFRHNKFTVEKAEDVLSFRPAPLAQPKKGFRVVCAPFLFHDLGSSQFWRRCLRGLLTSIANASDCGRSKGHYGGSGIKYGDYRA